MKKIAFVGLSVLLVVGLGAAYYLFKATKDYQPSTFWEVSSETNKASIDHSDWQTVLDGFLQSDTPSGVNLVDYESLLDESEVLDRYIDSLTKIDPRDYARNEQFAYWVNLYNAITLQVVVKNYPVSSILKISSGPLPSGPWDDQAATVAGQPLTLNDIEHRILRAFWKDHRIHFAVNCASIGCPNVQAQAFTSKNTESLLNKAAKEYMQHPRGLKITDDGLVLSSIFDWYKEDFGNSEKEVLATLSQYLSSDVKAQVEQLSSNVSYDYDWSLNDVQ